MICKLAHGEMFTCPISLWTNNILLFLFLGHLLSRTNKWSCLVVREHIYLMFPNHCLLWTSCNLMAVTLAVLNTCSWIGFQFCDSALGKRKWCQAKEMTDVRGAEIVKSSRGQGKVLLLYPLPSARASHLLQSGTWLCCWLRGIHKHVTNMINATFIQVTKLSKCLWLLPSFSPLNSHTGDSGMHRRDCCSHLPLQLWVSIKPGEVIAGGSTQACLHCPPSRCKS